MSKTTKNLIVPLDGLALEFGSDMINDTQTPKVKNVHVEDGEIRTKPGLVDFGPNGYSFKLYLYYDANDDSELALRDGAASNIKLAQSVTTAGVARTVDKVSLYLLKNGTITAGKKVWVTIEADDAGSPSGTALATSELVEANDIGATKEWTDFDFTTALSLVASTSYWIVLQGDYDVSDTNNIACRIDATSSPYTEGVAQYYDASWTAVGADQDLLFRIYRDEVATMFLGTFYLTTGSSYLMKATLDRLFYYDSNDDTWIDVTGYLTTNMFTGTLADKFSADAYPATNTFVISNYINTIKKWTGSGFVDVLANAPRAKYLKIYKDHLMLGNVYHEAADRPQRLVWSDAGDIEEYSTGTYGYKDFFDNIDNINGLFYLYDYLTVTKERSIYMGYPVTTGDIFQFDNKVSGVGPIDSRLVAELGTSLLMVAWDSWYLFDGNDLRDIASKKFRKEFYESTDPENIFNSFSLVMEETEEWHVFVPTSGNTYPNRVWVYNYKTNSIFQYEFSQNFTCAGWHVESSGVTIGDLVGTIGSQLWRIGDRTIVGFNAINLLGVAEGGIFKVDYSSSDDVGVAVEAYLDTMDFTFLNEKGERIRGRLSGIWIKAIGTNIVLKYSIDEGVNYTEITELTLNGSYATRKYNFRKSTEMIRFQFFKDGLGENFKLRSWGFTVRPGGRI